MNRITRRDFVKRSVLAGAWVTAAVPAPYARAQGANGDIRVAVVGLGSTVQVGGRGKRHVRDFNELPGVRVVALCDPDAAILEEELQKLKDQRKPADGYADVRKLLEDKNIDAVVVVTPNHWHALATIWACQAGKDVYVEKPVSHNIWEGRKMVEAAAKYGRIVHTGLSARSDPGLREAVQYIQDGNLGKILAGRGICYRPRTSIGRVPGPRPVPKTVDYDLWSGPAQIAPVMRENFHYDWHWFWPYGNGDLGNMGVHQLDGARWALGQTGLPPRVMGLGGRFGYMDDGQTPNTQVIVLDYEPAPLIFEVRGLRLKQDSEDRCEYKGIRVGIVIECEHGYLSGTGNGSGDTAVYDKNGKRLRSFEGDGSNIKIFIEAVRNRKPNPYATEIRDGHISTALVHMGNISYQVGRETAPDEIREAVQGDREALEAFERFREHMRMNEVDLGKDFAALGPTLEMDAKEERFIGGHNVARANKLLTRDYRAPFVVPQSV